MCSVLFGSAMKFVGRSPLMALGAVAHVSLLVVLLLWEPHPDVPYVFFAISGLWGIGDAVWQTQVNDASLGLYNRTKPRVRGVINTLMTEETIKLYH
ncbi:hypothetical protein J437_LFUL016431 [Ladona fulva]|uniref:Uncharacterized protein n=1 Tax=Ladona fulva TaxID=123851 RepID=A0A8K0KL86_LADFU|nr:hypothetical protein J437_LFUL016431 [Ladona fulva]